MEDAEAGRLTRENAYLKLRCAQLQDDVTGLGAELERVRQELERLHGARAARPAEATGGGD